LFDYVNRQKNYKADRRSAAKLSLNQSRNAPQSLQRHERSTAWFQFYRRGGRVILHHGHIRPVLIRDW
jgi:hypothetical protein